MSAKKSALISLAAVVLVIVVLVIVVFNKMYTPTKGRQISAYDEPRKALLVIDVQEDFTGLHGKQPVPLQGIEEQIAAINRIIETASESGMEVIYIRQLFDDNFLMRLLVGRAINCQPGAELDARIKKINQNDFTKKISDAFSNPQLDEFLVDNQVNELYLVGLDAAYCVYYTALGALNRGYKVTAVRDAMMTAKNMSEILNRYEKEGIEIITSRELPGLPD